MKVPGKQHLLWRDLGILAAATAAGAGAFAAAERLIAGTWGLPLDDAWIHLQLARNFSWEHGFAFNPGEPAAGSTAPLWTLLLALVRRLPGHPVLVPKVMGVLLLLATGWCTRGLARVYGLRPGTALLVALVVVLTPRLLWAALSGMEVMLGAALATAALWCHAAHWSRGPATGATLLFALASLARPECLILFPLAALDHWRGAGKAASWVRSQAVHIAVFAFVLSPVVWLNLRAIGRPLPNTFYAKVGGYGLLGALADGSVDRVVRALLLHPVLQAEELVHFCAGNNIVLAALLPFGLLALVRQRARGAPVSILPVLALVGYPLARGMLAPFQGATFQHGRYAAHLTPMAAVLAVCGLRLAGGLLLTSWRHRSRRGWRMIRVGTWLVIAMTLLTVDARWARTLGRDVRDIQRVHVTMGRWLAAHTAPAAVIAASDIGAVGYFSGRRVLDVAGLVTPKVQEYLRPGEPADQGVMRYLVDSRPDYLVILPNWYPDLVQHPQLLDPVFAVHVAGESIVGGPDLVAYRLRWEEFDCSTGSGNPPFLY